MNPEIAVNQQNQGGSGGSPGANFAGNVGSAHTPSHSVKAETKQQVETQQKPEVTSQVSANEDQVSISERGKASEETVKKTEEVVEERNKRSFESRPVSNSTVAFKTTDTNQLVMQVIDKDTSKILKQYPPEEMQRVSRALQSFVDSISPENDGGFSGIA